MPSEVRQRMSAGSQTLLVCAYTDEAKCNERMPYGAMMLADLDALPSLENTEIVFFCG